MFREDFVWGVASSAYQVEGTDAADGRGACVWDMFAADGRVFEHQNADTSCDHMHHYKEDIALMKHLGIRAYRFSLNWARILPEGTGRVNEKAIAMYRDMILTMKENGITPYLTLFHWEFPQALYERGGWQNPDVVQWFGEYAKVVAENFSDICEYFITINEPQCVVRPRTSERCPCSGRETSRGADVSGGASSSDGARAGGHQPAQICGPTGQDRFRSDRRRGISVHRPAGGH